MPPSDRLDSTEYMGGMHEFLCLLDGVPSIDTC